MAAPSKTQVFAGGRMIVNPSTSDSATHYGGTLLGTVGAVALRPRTRHVPHTRMDKAGAVVDSLYMGCDLDVVAVFAGYDTDALARIYHSVSSTLVDFGGLTRGSWLSDTAFALAYVPDVATAPGFYLPSCFTLHDSLRVPFSSYRPLAHAVRFLGVPSSGDDSPGYQGLASDLTGVWNP